MDLKTYREQPDEGLFENIQRRLRLRRAQRWGGMAAAAVAVVAAAALLIPHSQSATDSPLVVAGQPVSPAVQQPQSQPAARPAVVEPAATVATEPAAASPKATAEPAAKPERMVGEPVAVVPQPLPESPSVAVHIPMVPAAPAGQQPAAVTVASAAPAATAPAETSAAAPSPKAPTSEDESPTPENILWAPNVIYPGSDIDDNRTFGLTFTAPVSHFKIFIFNRSGRQLFTSTDPAFRWDGTYNGSQLPQGAYVWVAQFRDAEGTPVTKKGTITLLR